MVQIIARKPRIEYAVIDYPANNRPALSMTDPSHVVVHEVGNTTPGADEYMHRDFVRTGGGEHQVSFHGVTGDESFIQLIFANEPAWHASDGYNGWGNRDSFGYETVQIGDFMKTLAHQAWVVAETFLNHEFLRERGDLPFVDDLDPVLVMERTVQHNYTAPDRKNCPQFMRQRGLWIPFMQAVASRIDAEREPATPTKQYTPVNLPDFWTPASITEPVNRRWGSLKLVYMPIEYTARKEIHFRVQPGESKAECRPPLPKGAKISGLYRFTNKSGQSWVMTKYGSLVLASSLSPWISVRDLEDALDEDIAA